MAARNVVRAIPSLFVGVLVLGAAAAQSGPANPFRRLLPAKGGTFTAAATRADATRDRAATPAGVAATTCRAVTFTANASPPVADAVARQPGVVTITASSLSLSVLAGTGAPATFTAEVGFYDPSNASNPTLGSYPLHRGTLTASGLGPEAVPMPLDRAIVVRGIGEGLQPTPTAGLSFRSGAGDPVEVLYDDDGPLAYHPAFWDLGPGPIVPLQGAHPVLAHEVCGDTEGDDGLHVLSQVIRSDVVLSTLTAEMVQTFTCPVTVTADWVELAIAAPPGTPDPLEIVLFDMQGAFEPPFDSPVTITATLLDASALATPVWGASLPLTITAQLEAGRRYGLRIVTNGQWSTGAAMSPAGSELPDGELWSRPGPGMPYALEPDLDLSFRLIGRPVSETAQAPGACDDLALAGAITVTAQYPLPPGTEVVQPLSLPGDHFGVHRVAWSGHGGGGGGGGAGGESATDFDFVLAPPGSPPVADRIALRALDSPTFVPCVPPCDWTAAEFSTPIVTSVVTGVADGGLDDVPMLRWRAASGTAVPTLGYDENGSPPSPPALTRALGSFSWTQLPGPYAVVAHQVCAATPTANAPLRAVQQLLRAGHEFHGTATAGLLQTFRVPAPVEVSWAELGLRAAMIPAPNPVAIGLMAPGVCTCTADPTGGIPLGFAQGSTLTASAPVTTTYTAMLRPASPFPNPVTLTPGVDYWLSVTPAAEWQVAGSNASPYTEGRLYTSPGSGLPFSEETDRDLAFRLIGVPRPLMADSPTYTCCFGSAFATVTTTADFGGGEAPARSFAQVATFTASRPPGRLQLPLGSDGAAVTITASLRISTVTAQGIHEPLPDTYALTHVTITAAGGDMRWGEAVFDRPLVVRRFSDPVTITVEDGLAIVVPPPSGSPQGRAKLALGDPAVCTCTSVLQQTGGGSWEPMPGLSLGHVLAPITVTPVEPDLFEMTAVHAVSGATLSAEVVQVFRVPTACRVEWVELAVPGGQDPATPFEISIVDPQGLPAPPAGARPTSGTAVSFPPRASMALGSTWAASEPAPVSTTAMLVPGRDYWLSAHIPADLHVARAVTATAHVGRLYTRPPGNGPWSESEGALSFRLIGSSLVPLDAPPVAQPDRPMLSADPQPFTRELSLRWSGGSGRMSVEIFDARGRRVRHVRDAGTAVRGNWTWRGEDDFGRTVGAGVYFARVTPTSGPALRRRVVYLR